MKLWLLYPRDDLPTHTASKQENPWSPWFDKAFGFVVRAETEAEARHIANEHGGCENPRLSYETHEPPWLTDRYSICEELTAEGDAEMILRDFASA
jgi:predicted 3-demethylubiquinone-9 3-methyltransferase (glyoxalase superfamily)